MKESVQDILETIKKKREQESKKAVKEFTYMVLFEFICIVLLGLISSWLAGTYI